MTSLVPAHAGRPRRAGHPAVPRRWSWRFVLAAVVALGAVAGLAAPASAHATLESTEPAQGTAVPRSPGKVVLHFDEQVSISPSSIEVFNSAAKRVDSGGTTHVPNDSHSVETSIPLSLGQGGYVVTWRVVSADSHPVNGAFTFFIGAATSGGSINAEASQLLAKSAGSRTVGVLYGVVRFVAFATVCVLLGSLWFALVIWPGSATERRTAWILWSSLAMLALATASAFALQGVYGGGLPLSELLRSSVLTTVWHTRFGMSYAARLVFIALMAGIVLDVVRGVATTEGSSDPPDGTGGPDGSTGAAGRPGADPAGDGGPAAPGGAGAGGVGGLARRSPVLVTEKPPDAVTDPGPGGSTTSVGDAGDGTEPASAGRARWLLVGVCAVLSVAMLSTWGLADHASTGSLVWLSVPFDVVHLGSAAIWLGGLVMVLAVALPSRRAEGRSSLTRFSQWALAAVVAIVATGVFAAWRQIGLSWGALTTTTYGRLVLYKVAGLVVLVALASISRTAVHGELAVPGRRRRPSRATRVPNAVPTPGAEARSTPGADVRSTPGVEMRSTPGAEVRSTPGVDPVPTSRSEPAAPSSPVAGAPAVAPAAGAPSARSGSVATGRRSAAAEPGVLSGWLFGRRAAGAAPRRSAPGTPSSGGPASGSAGAPATVVDGVPGHRLRTAVALEIAVILAVLAVTAFLVNARPAKQAYSAPFYAEVKAGPTLVDVVVDPAKAGPLTIHLYVLTAAGLVDNVPEVDATMSNRAAGISNLPVPLQVGGPGHFLTAGFDIPIAGNWTMNIVVRTTNIDDYFADPIVVHIR